MDEPKDGDIVQIGTGEESFSRSMATFAALSDEGLKPDVLLCHAEIRDPDKEDAWVPVAWVADGKSVILDARTANGNEPVVVKWEDEAEFEEELRVREKHVYTWIQAQYYLEQSGSCGPWRA